MRMIALVATTQDADRLRQFWTAFRWTAAAGYTWASAHLDGAGEHGVVELYCLFILWDFVTGVVASALQHKVKSCIALRGILKKLMGLSFVACAHSVDVALASQLGAAVHQHTVMGTVARLMIGYEIISIAENLSTAGITIPSALKDTLRKFTGNPEVSPEQEGDKELVGAGTGPGRDAK